MHTLTPSLPGKLNWAALTKHPDPVGMQLILVKTKEARPPFMQPAMS